MSDVLPLDAVLESLVGAIVDLIAPDATGGEVYVTGAPWEVVFDVEEDSFFFDFVPLSAEVFNGLDDYQLATIFSLGFEPVDEEDALPLLRQEYEFDNRDEWEEESVRQLSLLALGLLRDVFRVEGADSLTIRRGDAAAKP